MNHIDLFSGIGGFSLAADKVFGEMNHVFVEYDSFCQAVLLKHWPQSKIYGDIKKFTKKRFIADTRSKESGGVSQQSRKEGIEIGDVYLLTGGFPCQPFSQAGRRGGTEDDRYLWPEMFRVIQEFKPTWVVAENVRGLATWNDGMVLEQVCTDLESEGYEVQPIIIPAVAVNAPHRRDRIWFIAYSKHRTARHSECRWNEQRSSIRTSRSDTDDPNSSNQGLQGRKSQIGKRHRGQSGRNGSNKRRNWNKNWFEIASELCRVDDGIPRRLDRASRLKALGNSIVPQVAQEIFKTIKIASKNDE